MILDMLSRAIRDGDKVACLSNQECRIAAAIFSAYPRPATREKIIEAVWHPDDEPDGAWKQLDVMVFRIRRAMKLAGLPAVVKSRRGTGFISSVEVPVEEVRPAITIAPGLLEDIAGLLATHADFRRARHLLARLPAVG